MAEAGVTHRDSYPVFLGKDTAVRSSGIIFPRGLSQRAWEKIGMSLGELTNSSAWWLADWLIFGESSYGWSRYREAIDRTGLDYQTLRNYAWVARRFEHERRRDGLSFAHHAEVARMSPPEQDFWLRKAEQQKWSRNELRRQVRASLAEQSNDSGDTPVTGKKLACLEPAEPASAQQRRRAATTITIELPADRMDYYSKMALSQGLSVDQWVTRVLDTVDRSIA